MSKVPGDLLFKAANLFEMLTLFFSLEHCMMIRL